MSNSSEESTLVRKLVRQRLGKEAVEMRTPSVGDANHTFIVNENYVVKLEKNEDWTSEWQDEMYRETVVLEILKDSSLKVPEIIETGQIDGRYFRIMDYLEGETLDKYSEGRNFHKLDEEEKINLSQRLGKKLGEIHASQNFDRFGVIQPENGITVSDNSWSKGVLSLQNWWLKKLRGYGYEEIAKRVEKIFEEYSETLDEVEESTLLHMEFGLRNLLFQKDEIVILDWETSAVGDPLLDFIMSQKRIFWLNEEDEKFGNAFREGYSEVRSVELDREKELLYELFQMTRFLVIFSGKEDTESRIRDRIKQIFDSL